MTHEVQLQAKVRKVIEVRNCVTQNIVRYLKNALLLRISLFDFFANCKTSHRSITY